MAIGDEKLWKKTRMEACKGSGVAEACKLWKKHCVKPADIADDADSVRSARIAISKMRTALKTAHGKYRAVKEADNKKVGTGELLQRWTTELDAYETALEAAVK